MYDTTENSRTEIAPRNVMNRRANLSQAITELHDTIDTVIATFEPVLGPNQKDSKDTMTAPNLGASSQLGDILATSTLAIHEANSRLKNILDRADREVL